MPGLPPPPPPPGFLTGLGGANSSSGSGDFSCAPMPSNLLSSIQQGNRVKLKPRQTNDRSQANAGGRIVEGGASRGPGAPSVPPSAPSPPSDMPANPLFAELLGGTKFKKREASGHSETVPSSHSTGGPPAVPKGPAFGSRAPSVPSRVPPVTGNAPSAVHGAHLVPPFANAPAAPSAPPASPPGAPSSMPSRTSVKAMPPASPAFGGSQPLAVPPSTPPAAPPRVPEFSPQTAGTSRNPPLKPVNKPKPNISAIANKKPTLKPNSRSTEPGSHSILSPKRSSAPPLPSQSASPPRPNFRGQNGVPPIPGSPTPPTPQATTSPPPSAQAAPAFPSRYPRAPAGPPAAPPLTPPSAPQLVPTPASYAPPAASAPAPPPAPPPSSFAPAVPPYLPAVPPASAQVASVPLPPPSAPPVGFLPGRRAPPAAPPGAVPRTSSSSSARIFQRSVRTEEKRITIDDKRFKFQEKNDIPEPRQFPVGHFNTVRLYPSGRGATVPLNMSLYS